MTALCDQDLDVHDSVEVHWSTSTILAIFFAASLISAVFFGLGYSFGGVGASKHPVAIASAETTGNSTGSAAMQMPSNRPAAFSESAVGAGGAGNAGTQPRQRTPSTVSAQAHSAAAARTTHPAGMVARQHSTPAPSVAHAKTIASGASGPRVMVQVGAIGNRKDAERLVAELRKKGFHAGIYSEKHDKFLHVQIGPYKDVQQAQSKRHQVMASGFHAILKSTS
ncbi:MAG TPA: SPOR domain-containing protein [Acidobacteriaceae bacterium]|nr:SPOR domain-containing protein [Acidobacteriaceae bacterium]